MDYLLYISAYTNTSYKVFNYPQAQQELIQDLLDNTKFYLFVDSIFLPKHTSNGKSEFVNTVIENLKLGALSDLSSQLINRFNLPKSSGIRSSLAHVNTYQDLDFVLDFLDTNHHETINGFATLNTSITRPDAHVYAWAFDWWAEDDLDDKLLHQCGNLITNGDEYLGAVFAKDFCKIENIDDPSHYSYLSGADINKNKANIDKTMKLDFFSEPVVRA